MRILWNYKRDKARVAKIRKSVWDAESMLRNVIDIYDDFKEDSAARASLDGLREIADKALDLLASYSAKTWYMETMDDDGVGDDDNDD